MLKSDYEGVKKLMKQVHQLHYVNHRKSGIGRELYDYAAAVAKAYEATGIELTVWAFNQDATRFYESLGMTPMNMTMEKKL